MDDDDTTVILTLNRLLIGILYVLTFKKIYFHSRIFIQAKMCHYYKYVAIMCRIVLKLSRLFRPAFRITPKCGSTSMQLSCRLSTLQSIEIGDVYTNRLLLYVILLCKRRFKSV